MPAMESLKSEIAATAARLVVEEGLEYGPAKRRASKQLGLASRRQLVVLPAFVGLAHAPLGLQPPAFREAAARGKGNLSRP